MQDGLIRIGLEQGFAGRRLSSSAGTGVCNTGFRDQRDLAVPGEVDGGGVARRSRC